MKRVHVGVSIALVLLSACSGTGDVQKVISKHTLVDPNLVTFHRVLSTTALPCQLNDANHFAYPASGDVNGRQCLELGPAEVNATSVAKAQLAQDPQSGELNGVDLEFNPEGSAAFDRMAASSQHKPVAILVNGKLVSAPIVESDHFEGKVQISGLSVEEARRLVQDLGGTTTVTTTKDAAALVRARKAGQAYGEKSGVGEPIMSVATVAEDVVKTLRFEKSETAAPWDKLPASHFVAECSFSIAEVQPVSTTICSDGVGGLSKDLMQFYVDEEGRSSKQPPLQDLVCK